MKTFSSLVISLLFIFFFSNMNAQNILVVDNNPTAPSGAHVYSTIQAAVDAAVDDDIIHIMPSPTNYGAVSLSKRLNLYGIGYTPDTETAYNSMISTCLMYDGASGSFFSGIYFTTQSHGFNFYNNSEISDVVIEKCRLAGISDDGAGTIVDLIIRDNVFNRMDYGSGSVTPINLSTILGATSGVVITNNILCSNGYSNGGYAYGIIQAANFTVITNNLFMGNGATNITAFRSLKDCIITNNIFYGAATNNNGTDFYNNTFSNNISFGGADTSLPPAGVNGTNGGYGNMVDVDPLMPTIGFNLIWGIFDNAELSLGSPAFAAGTDGFDIGLSGGTYPFSFYGHGTPLPYIHILNNAGLVIEGQDLNTTATARSNQ